MAEKDIYKFAAVVNGVYRFVCVAIDPTEWGFKRGETVDAETVERVWSNEPSLYYDFYARAYDEDYDAPFEDVEVAKLVPARWEVVE